MCPGKRKDLGKSQDEGPVPCDRILRERETSKESFKRFSVETKESL